MPTHLPEESESSNLYIKNADSDDMGILQSICNSWTDKSLMEGEEFPSDYLSKCLSIGDLPPIKKPLKANYRIKVIGNKKSNDIIGFFEIYHGYPSPSILWISMFVISSNSQHAGYGGEIIELLSRKAKESGYAGIGIGVHLKNWKGLRFWTQNGFDKVTGISGDKEYATDKFSVIKLQKIL